MPDSPHYLVVGCSLKPGSRSMVMADAAFQELQESKADARFIKLTDYPMPFCNASTSSEDENTLKLAEHVTWADCILLGVPIYNFDINAAAKNFLELTGRKWTGKVVGFLCAAGGQGSYMSVMAFANSLMLDFRCWIVPRFVYATGGAFEDGKIVDPEVRARVTEIVQTAMRASEARLNGPE